MAISAETWPQDPDETRAEVHVGRRLRVIEKNGKFISFQDPGNFPWVLKAYMSNRFAELSDDNHIRDNQNFLATTPVGRIVTESLDTICDDEEHIELVHQTFIDLPENESAYIHAKIIDLAAQHLPKREDLEAPVFRDPWAFKAAA